MKIPSFCVVLNSILNYYVIPQTRERASAISSRPSLLMSD
nr:MAG TPA: hypothetical protein [Caudoviricetes sp.]